MRPYSIAVCLNKNHLSGPTTKVKLVGKWVSSNEEMQLICTVQYDFDVGCKKSQIFYSSSYSYLYFQEIIIRTLQN
jgi:hypothetical protein